MARRLSGRLTYANVIATIALFVSLGGGAYAASGGFGSGGKLRICIARSGAMKAVRSSGRCSRGQQLVSVSQKGTVGPRGATGKAGAQGAPGAAGASARSTLPAGASESGEYALSAGSGGLYAMDGVTFPIPLAAGLPAANVLVLPTGTTSSPNCPGRGQADAGYLCIYETNDLNNIDLTSSGVYTGLFNSQNGTSTVGFIAELVSPSTFSVGSFGTWTVTAP